MDPASIVAFVGFGIQVVDVIKRCIDLIAQVKDAPNSVQRLQTELEILKSIIVAAVSDKGEKFKYATEESFTAYQKALAAVDQLCVALLTLLLNTLPHGRVSRRKRLLGSLNFVLQEEKLAGLVAELERAKSSLLLAQQGIASESNARSTRKLEETHAHMLKLMQTIVRTGERSEVEGVTEHQIDAWECFSLESINTVREILGDQGEPDEAIDTAKLENTQCGVNDNCTRLMSNSVSTHLTKPKHTQFGMDDNIARMESTSYNVRSTKIQQVQESASTMESLEIKNQTWHASEPTTHECNNSDVKHSDLQRNDKLDGSLSEVQNICQDSTRESGATLQRLPVLQTSLTPIDNPSNHRISALKSRNDATMFHNPLLGTVLVTRRVSVAKEWNTERQCYEKRHDGVSTIIRVRPSPWLLDRGYEIRKEDLITRYGESTLHFSLDALRYTPLTAANRAMLRDGDLSKLQRKLEERTMSLKDRDPESGMNLLESTMEALSSDWFNWEMDSYSTGSKSRFIVRTARWLLSQGLTYDFDTDRNRRLLYDYMYLGAPECKDDLQNQVYELECLLLESTENASCIERAKTLLFFAMCNPERSQDLRFTILDLIQEAAVDYGPQYFAEMKRKFWATGEPIGLGMESVIACSLLQMAKTMPEDGSSMRRHVLSGPRRLIYRSLLYLQETKQDASQELSLFEKDHIIGGIANILDLCKSLAILDDGFGDHLTNLACRDHYLDDLLKVLERAFYDPDAFMTRHRQQQRSLKHPVELTVRKTNKLAGQSVEIISRDPHKDRVEKTEEALKPSQDDHKEVIYATHKGDSQDLCFAPREGTELQYSCFESVHCECVALHDRGDVIFWSSLDRLTEYYTSLEETEVQNGEAEVQNGEAEVQKDEASPASGSILRQLVSVGLVVMSSVV